MKTKKKAVRKYTTIDKDKAIAKKRGTAVLAIVLDQREQHKEWARILCNKSKVAEHAKAANGIYKAFYNSLIYYFMRKIGANADMQDLQDLTMQTLEKTFSKIKQYNPKKGALSTWVFCIALNCLRDHMRNVKGIDVVSVEALNAHNVRVMGESDAEIFELSSNDIGPADMADRQQQHGLVRDAIAGLKNKSERKVVELRFLKEYTYEEIAETLEMPMGTVKALIYRAKERLSEVLSEDLELENA